MAGLAIDARGLTKWFGEGEARTRALADVSVQARFGEMLLIVGPSGSGKTTLLSVMSGILRPDAGSVIVDGVDLWAQDNDAIAEFRLNRIGFVFQDYHLFARLTTAENVAIPLILKRRDWNRALADAHEYLDVVGLRNRASLPPVKLSGGAPQRVTSARGLIAAQPGRRLDEPTASLDAENRDVVAELIGDKVLNDKRCIVIVTHDSRIFDYADRILRMEDGKLTAIERGGGL